MNEIQQADFVKYLIDGNIHAKLRTITKNLPHKTLTITDGIPKSKSHHYDKSGARGSGGVYIHYEYGTGKPLYVGKSHNDVGARQTSHTSSFNNPKSKHEMSGRKYNEYMTEKNVNELIINPVWIDLNGGNNSYIEMIERILIYRLNPLINDMVKTVKEW